MCSSVSVTIEGNLLEDSTLHGIKLEVRSRCLNQKKLVGYEQRASFETTFKILNYFGYLAPK